MTPLPSGCSTNCRTTASCSNTTRRVPVQFEPLRFVPKDKVVVLGLVSTKVAELETVEALKRRIGEASKFIPLDQLAISPQCGFASDVVGNLLGARRSEAQARDRGRNRAAGVGIAGQGQIIRHRLPSRP